VTDEPLEKDEPEPRTDSDTEANAGTATTADPPPRPEASTATASATTPAAPRRLYRSRDDNVIAGVCGGLGEYFGIDSTLVRIAFVLLVFAGGLGILAYILAWLFIGEEPRAGETGTESTFDRAASALGTENRSGAVVLGLVFVALGILFLLDVAWPDFLSWRYAWPIALIAVGLAIVMRSRR